MERHARTALRSVGLAVLVTALASPHPIAGQAAGPAFPKELQPAGSAVDVLRFDLLRKECEARYPSIMALVYAESAKSLRVGKNRSTLELGRQPGVVFGGLKAGRPAVFVLDTVAISKAATDPDGSVLPSPRWASTRCMVLMHELWEYGVGSHEAGVALENIVRSVERQPPRYRSCGPIQVTESGPWAYFIEIGEHTEVLWLDSQRRLDRIEPKPRASQRFRCPPD